MKAKEKAKEMYDKMLNSDIMNMTKHCAKHCALIAVDEIISLMIKFNGRHIENNLTEIKYWEEVKQEIEKL